MYQYCCLISLLIHVSRNGVSGQVKRVKNPASLPLKYRSRRVRRTRLQAALIAKVPQGIIQLNKRLVSIEDAGTQGVRLSFEDGAETIADLVIGGDGIRSVSLSPFMEFYLLLIEKGYEIGDFPRTRYKLYGYSARYTCIPNDASLTAPGTTIWRTLVPAKSLSHIPNLVPETSWWHGPAGHCYFSLVDDPSEFSDSSSEQMLEVSCRYIIDPALDTERRFSWGVPATNERVTAHFTVIFAHGFLYSLTGWLIF